MSSISRVAVVATGGIGASWVTYFMARGLDVCATDPAPGAEDALHRRIRLYWPVLEKAGLAPGASIDRVRFMPTIGEAVQDAQFVQENGPEKIDVKHEIFRQMSEAAPPETPLVSSSSSLLVSDMQQAAFHPERVVLGHPFNPPHLIPLVEVAGGKQTSEEAIARVMDFYRAIGKSPIRLKREVVGHIANRLQTAIWREAFHLVAAGVATAEDIDTAITDGPGLRWAINGPCMVLHVSGGSGGIRSTLGHMGPAMIAMAEDLASGGFSPEMLEATMQSVEDMARGQDADALARYRDEGLLRILKAKQALGSGPPRTD